MKILTIIGARPQFIKAAIVSQELRKHDGVQRILIHTGQHFDAKIIRADFETRFSRPAVVGELRNLYQSVLAK